MPVDWDEGDTHVGASQRDFEPFDPVATQDRDRVTSFNSAVAETIDDLVDPGIKLTPGD